MTCRYVQTRITSAAEAARVQSSRIVTSVPERERGAPERRFTICIPSSLLAAGFQLCHFHSGSWLPAVTTGPQDFVSLSSFRPCLADLTCTCLPLCPSSLWLYLPPCLTPSHHLSFGPTWVRAPCASLYISLASLHLPLLSWPPTVVSLRTWRRQTRRRPTSKAQKQRTREAINKHLFIHGGLTQPPALHHHPHHSTRPGWIAAETRRGGRLFAFLLFDSSLWRLSR